MTARWPSCLIPCCPPEGIKGWSGPVTSRHDTRATRVRGDRSESSLVYASGHGGSQVADSFSSIGAQRTAGGFQMALTQANRCKILQEDPDRGGGLEPADRQQAGADGVAR